MTAQPTPMMAQYLEIKGRHEDALLFYRMGDFYEMFFDDAKAAAQALDIALTTRGKHLGEDIPMCGVPVERAEGYLLNLIRKGFRVAVCEQLEDPAEAKKRGSKSVVKRDVTRIVTPGTLTEEALLEPRAANWLAAFAEIRGAGALAWAELSTGELRVTALERAALPALLARLSPRELLLSEAGFDEPALRGAAEEAGAAPTPLGPAAFDSAGAEARLRKLLGVASLEGFGAFIRPELAALGAVAEYLALTQKAAAPRLRAPVREEEGGAMRIDAATRRNLELTRAMSGGREGSLLAAIDRCVTAPGARLLELRLAAPLTDPAEIGARLDQVEAALTASALRADLRRSLRGLPDIARALSRIALERAAPRDLCAIRDGLAAAGEIAARLDGAPAPLTELGAGAQGLDDLAETLDTMLAAEPPARLSDGGLVAAGALAELDDTRRMRDEGRKVIGAMQADYQRETGVSSLKIKHNNVLGYFIETPATHADTMLGLSERFIHRQTMAGALRFTTAELGEMERKILGAGEQALAIERRVFAELCDACLNRAADLAQAADALAALDLTTALAELAEAEGWTRPRIDRSGAFHIEGGRHPVVEQALRRRGEGDFVPNDCALPGEGDGAIRLLTGPNMAGKSTFLRQNALIALLAQTGSYVPAASAHLGVADRLFSRVGAADDLARGRSTFMVEMVETAAILNQAGPGALVILDEIGRGTATYDGLSIAWAVVEHLHDVNRCRALFATHYHELTALADRLDRLGNLTMAVREWEGEVVFLHEVRAGAADRSYGVQVARLAGLPEAAVGRAREILEALERGDIDQSRRAATLIDDLPLFNAAAPAPVRPAVNPALEALRGADPDAMTPREALDFLYRVRQLAED